MNGKGLEDVPHPGARIKAEVIPQGMSVTAAAKLVGVGRPALSNLLNGNAALSAEMAIRLEKAFKYPQKSLMEMQARHDAARAKRETIPANTRTYVPPFLAIKANDIVHWVTHNIQARSRLPVFLRGLVHSTGSGLTKVDFPGNDDAELPGWDGWVEANDGTPWVPAGRSGWEFGTNKDVKRKADKDFEKSVKLDKKERETTTFVFVTPRIWDGKASWVAAKQKEGLWKDVRAYDACDLEQWLEQSLTAQAWFANETGIPAQDVRSLDKCWADWADVSEPPLTRDLFRSAIVEAKRIVLSRLSKPPDGPTVIAADSTEEALAFVAQLFSEYAGEELAAYRHQVLVFDKPGVLPRLAEGARSFIPIAFTREVERDLGPYAKKMHSIVVYPRSATSIKPDIVLQPASYETFTKALEAMGCDRDRTSRLAKESGRSLTVLRRRLASVPALKLPAWAADRQTAESLLPFLFVGAWNSANIADTSALSLLAGDRRPYSELERDCQRLSQLDDSPVWSISNWRGVVSKIDLLFAISSHVTAEDLKRYFDLARMVLGEDDPTLDLPEDQRWAAAIHGKKREFSGAFREGISETLVLLAVHGGHLFKNHLGIDTEVEAALVVRELLASPLTTRVLEANDRDLPTYAEVAPEEFLSILERDLKSDEPAVLGLLRPAATGLFGHPSRTGLLWALEGLSWEPTTLPRVVFILARLAQVEINDNWINKPSHSLESIFRSRMPQTAASLEARVDLMKKLAQKFPAVAWKLCVAQFGNHFQEGHYSHKPRWRTDGHGFGEPLPTREPIVAFIREVVEMALTWKDHSLAMLCDLVERLHDLTVADQDRTWELIAIWAKGRASDADKSTLREKIRISTLSRRSLLRARRNGRSTSFPASARAVYAALEPSDLIERHAWLFRAAWVEESVDEIDKIHKIEKLNSGRRGERIQTLRTEALHEIHNELGLTGLLDIATRGQASGVIGQLCANFLPAEGKLGLLLTLALQSILADHKNAHPHKNLIAGALRSVANDEKREELIKSVLKDLPENDIVELLALAPFAKGIWILVDSLGEAAQTKYWTKVAPDWIHGSDAEQNEGVERLLKAGRPRAAFSCIRLNPEQLDAELLFRLLSEIQGGANEPGQCELDNYDIEEAFKYLNNNPRLTITQKAGLEFRYLEILAPSSWNGGDKYGIPNLERYIEENPEEFVWAISAAYGSHDDNTDSEDQVSPAQVERTWVPAYRLLKAIGRLPGHNDLGELKAERLSQWISTVRQSCSQMGQAEVGDKCIGELLSRSPVGKDGVWPCEEVRDVMEEIESEHVLGGAARGAYIARGAHWRGEGGEQERELAAKFRKWGQALIASHPFVASKLLMSLAKAYDQEADREDTEAGINRRLR